MHGRRLQHDDSGFNLRDRVPALGAPWLSPCLPRFWPWAERAFHSRQRSAWGRLASAGGRTGKEIPMSVLRQPGDGSQSTLRSAYHRGADGGGRAGVDECTRLGFGAFGWAFVGRAGRATARFVSPRPDSEPDLALHLCMWSRRDATLLEDVLAGAAHLSWNARHAAAGFHADGSATRIARGPRRLGGSARSDFRSRPR